MRVDRTVPVYPIGVVERLTGLSARKIRYYEAMGLVPPSRTPGTQRLYSPADVDRLLEIKRLLAEGLNLQGVRARLHATHGPHPAGGAPPPEHAPPSDVDREYIITQMRAGMRSEEHTSELQSREKIVCRLPLEKITHDNIS